MQSTRIPSVFSVLSAVAGLETLVFSPSRIMPASIPQEDLKLWPQGVRRRPCMIAIEKHTRLVVEVSLSLDENKVSSPKFVLFQEVSSITLFEESSSPKC
jgi:hypothetical protein